MPPSVDDIIRSISKNENEILEKIETLKSKYGAVFQEYNSLTAQLDELQKAKDEVKGMLIAAEDFDLHKVDGVKVSVCPVVKLEVEDLDAVEDKYKSTEVVANVKKAQEAKKLFGELPAGFKDKTYYRLAWKDENAR